jgi:hypothetical protein
VVDPEIIRKIGEGEGKLTLTPTDDPEMFTGEFQVGQRVRRHDTQLEGVVVRVNRDPSQIIAPLWYDVRWDGGSLEGMLYPRELEIVP